MSVLLLLGAFGLRSILQVEHLDPDTDAQLRSASPNSEGNVLRDLPSRDLVSFAAHEFESGLKLRHDAAKARPWFREAARMYHELWRRGFRDPNLALNRAHARRLAGDIPGAIVALNEGLAAARWNRPLQIALEDARSTVAYTVHSNLATFCRPTPPATIGTRMSPREAQVIAGVLWILLCGSIARFAMTRAEWWLGFAGVWLVALASLGALWWHDHRVRTHDEHAVVVIAQDVHLRKGNAETFPLRLEGPYRLPRGVEARELTSRGGWVQIKLVSGIIGWVPETAVLRTGD